MLYTVFLATVLFFSGIAPRIGWALVSLPGVMLVVGLYDLATFPIASL